MELNNKKGWIRIVESSLAVIIILGIFALISYSNNLEKPSSDINQLTNQIIIQISEDNSLREKIFNNPEEAVSDIINILNQDLSSLLQKDVLICPDICDLPPINENSEVYHFKKVFSVKDPTTPFSLNNIKVLEIYLSYQV